MRSVFALVALLFLVGLAAAQTVCLSGSIDMTLTASAAETEYCNRTQCTLAFELSFEPSAADSDRWPLTVALQDGTALADRWPELDSVTLQCNTGGDIIATTRFAGAGEHLRLIWTYSGANSVMCSYALQTVDWTADFVSAQAVLVYGANESVGTADALWYSEDGAAHSLGAETVDCPAAPIDTAATTDATTGAGLYTPDELGECRYPRSVWQTSRRDAAQWLALKEETICGIAVADIVMGTGDSAQLPASFGALAAEVGVAMLNAAMYTRTLAEVNESVVLHAYEVVSEPLNCATAHDFSGMIAELAAYSNSTTTCTGGGACPVTMADVEGAIKLVEKKALSKSQGLVIGLIVCAVVAGVFVGLTVLLAVVLIYDWLGVHRGRIPVLGGGSNSASRGYAPVVVQAQSDGMQA